ncbi:hypothetical protein NX722_28430 [Endozoicomonas gorgoniicola]|uniref:Portal protein n=1 Tax=Endozoicomonas gorgoniicola TaxID=1234144 RepID=A0ABT3N4F1_9GAMM|nr:hypothetical protein [Endozoicomonas gorgoniicola]MCW7556494.1 hypothetical protein [Endozoicomonas gorgoniicola]
MEQTLTEKQIEQLDHLGQELQKLCEDNASKRSSIEQRWLKDSRQKHGDYEPDLKTKLDQAGGSKLFRNETRPKCRVAKAQLARMLFPTDDRNYGIEPTPVPQTISDLQAVQQEALQQAMDEAKEAAKGMNRQIEDDLTEAEYYAKGRRVVSDAVDLGTGILKGPVVVNRTRKAWVTNEDGIHALQVVTEPRAGIERVSPWDYYPDMSATCKEDVEFEFERHRWTKRRLREFAKLNGVIQSSVKELLEQEARSTHSVQDHTAELREITGVDSVKSSSLYEVWEYHGPIKKADLEVCGCAFDEGDERDSLTEIQGIVWFAGGKVLKAVLHPQDTEDSPYSVFNWERDDSCIFGFGVPYQIRHPQTGVNAAWRMLFDNAGLSAGPQIVIDEDAIDPVDGDWRLAPRKVWKKKKNIAIDGNFRPFEVFNIDCNQSQIAAVLELASQAADEEGNIPLIAQGEQDQSMTKTHGGMALLANAAMTVFQDPVKNFDDCVIIPTIKRFYDFHMQYHSRPDIKGDFQVKARGSSVLLLKEVQSQALMSYLQLAGNDPEFRKRTDYSKLVPEVVKSMQVTASDILIDEEKVQENEQNAGQDPALMAAQMDMQMKQQDQQFRQQLEVQKLEQAKELEMYRIAASNDMKLAELEQKLGIEQTRVQAQRDIAALNGTLKQNEMNLKSETGSGI